MAYVKVADLDQLGIGVGFYCSAGDRDLALFRLEDGVYAIDDLCTHSEASLAEGEVEGHAVSCPAHGARFDLRTGRVLSLPAYPPVRTYPVRVAGGEVFVDVEDA